MITRLCPRPQKLVLEANSTDLDKTLQTVSINHDISQDDCFPQYRARAVATGSLANQGITTTSPPLLTATPLPNANPPSVVSRPPVQQPQPRYQLPGTSHSQVCPSTFSHQVFITVLPNPVVSSTWKCLIKHSN
ncbi:hypothetical protein PVAP13_6NG108203 [Panicum virgatum]|uniref:Uncharacterized protein n=1 Tax=Panicum virgatum TaxID=38727 RepID=A0A8T0QWW6_PANVG|nr:hypothetical protein PVAP13_6NG108203 [Panicum virgatum]